jgi:hypothetical protein
MIVRDLHLVGIVLVPYKTHPPLIINAYGVLPFSFSFEFLQPVARWRTEILYRLGVVQHPQLQKCRLLDGCGKVF